MSGADERAELQLGVRGQEETIRAAEDNRVPNPLVVPAGTVLRLPRPTEA